MLTDTLATAAHYAIQKSPAHHNINLWLVPGGIAAEITAGPNRVQLDETVATWEDINRRPKTLVSIIDRLVAVVPKN